MIELIRQHSRVEVLDAIHDVLEKSRQALMKNERSEPPSLEELVENVIAQHASTSLPGLRRCVNGAGVVLHTALGRSPIAVAAQKALADVVQHYCTLQVDLRTGKRGDRYAHVEPLLQRLTGAEAALVVNNNAAATLLLLNTLAEGREVIISRGELVEIGGSFRIPDVMKRSGARLVEVGTTNRTHLRDYKNALTPETAIVLKVHQSNYRIEGFTSAVEIGELADLAHAHGVLAVDDIGSGALVDVSRWGLPREPLVRDAVAAGADAVCFSGDKLVGGPQCGIIVGKRQVIDRLKSNQLTRALRCGKLTFAVLEATLRLFLDEERLLRDHPVMHMLTAPAEELRARATVIAERLRVVLAGGGHVEIQEDTSETGSGSLATVQLPTWVVAVSVDRITADQVAAGLRGARIPVLGRVSREVFLLDSRTIRDDEIDLIVQGFTSLLAARDVPAHA
jgi:L-seryl-tRNA(Ser) seleniumtransferase